jgi:hypothetical protein
MEDQDKAPEDAKPTAVIRQVAQALAGLVRALQAGARKKVDVEAAGKLASDLLASGRLPRLEVALREIAEAGKQRTGERIAALGAAEAAAVRVWRDAGEFVRQTDSGWRIGHLELHLDKKAARGKVMYHGQTVVPPEPIEDAAALQALLETAKAKLAEVAGVARSDLPPALWDAYHYVSRRSAGSTQGAELREVLEELRIALLRRSHGEKQQLAALKLPSWALSWLLDEAFRPAPPVQNGRRLVLRTGTQRETREMGVRVGAREPGGEFQIFCYMQDVAVAPEAQSSGP